LWNNAILLGTHWGYDQKSVANRKKQGITEEKRRKALNEKLKKYHGLKKDLGMVFLETLYDKDDPDQLEKFKENTDNLWTLANQIEPFDCKDVQAARLQIKQLMEERDKQNKQIIELQNNITIFKNKVDILENPPVSTPSPLVQSRSHTSMEFIMASIGFCVLGILIALVATAALRRFSQESEDYNVHNERGEATMSGNVNLLPGSGRGPSPPIEDSSPLNRQNSTSSSGSVKSGKGVLEEESKSRHSELATASEV